ncbi:MAG: fumarate reductase subunit D [Geminicoccaceae bacterium]|nr:MAG: fumarate reductase subunit D [Geminicoccaceae bacterium]
MSARRPSHKPLVWLPFAAGGMFAALFLPVVILVTTGLILPGATTFEAAHGFASHWLGKLVLFGFVLLPVWHAAHRLRVTAYDFGIRADELVAKLVYGGAALLTLLALIFLLQI